MTETEQAEINRLRRIEQQAKKVAAKLVAHFDNNTLPPDLRDDIIPLVAVLIMK